jgi:type IV pilus assembly protein PilM
MLSLFSPKKIRAFGLDISDVSVKVMQLSSKDGKVFPSAFTTQPLPGNLIANHLIVSPERLAEQVRHAVDSAGRIDTEYVVASVPEIKSFVRTVSIPKMAYEEVDSALPWELEQDIPVPIDQVYMDWQVMSEAEDKMNLLVMAAPKDYIDSLIETLKLAKLKPVALELESQATARALVGKEDMGEPVLILDMSATQTSFIIVDSGHLMYTSGIPIAGNAFTESIARNLGIPAAEAEKLKKQMGLKGESKKGNIHQAILPILDNVVDEIRNIIHFYEEHSATHARISKIYVCGGTAKLSGLTDYISARLNLGSGRGLSRVVLGNPFANLAARPDKKTQIDQDQALGYATAAGLAIRGLEPV